MAEHAEQRLDGDDGLLGLGAGAGDRPHQQGGGTPRPRPRPRLLAGHGGGAAAGRGSRILHLAHAELSAQEVQIKYVNTLCNKEGGKCPSIPCSLRRSPLLLAAAALQLCVHRGNSSAQVHHIYPVQLSTISTISTPIYNIYNIYNISPWCPGYRRWWTPSWRGRRAPGPGTTHGTWAQPATPCIEKTDF